MRIFNRRQFLGTGSLAIGAWALPQPNQPASASVADPQRAFTTDDAVLDSTWKASLAVLSGNIHPLFQFPQPVLVEGSVYPGAWLECAPLEGLAYSYIDREVARNNHLIFFALQKEDGQLPCSVKKDTIGFGQIQMVVPIAATAWELAQRCGDQELLEKAYAGSARWDAWLVRYRNTRGTGLCEGFCTYDTGHDNSPRWAGIPNRCPDADARKCPDIAGMPRLCPDLSATVYGQRVALAAMAKALGKAGEESRWLESAAQIRRLILEKLYSPEDAAFYDLDANGKLVRIRGDVISRVLGEHVVDQPLFETIYARQIHNPSAFWAPYPLPSIALDDPAFVRPIPRNSWGGATQALTALRAPRWFEHYGKPADLGWMMQRWIEAIGRHTEFRQQMDPLTGDFTQADPSGYSPAALVFFDFLWRLSGVRELGEPEGSIEWNIRPPVAKGNAKFSARVHGKTAEIAYRNGMTVLRLNGRDLVKVSGTGRLLSDIQGKFTAAIGIDTVESALDLFHPNHITRLKLKPNEVKPMFSARLA